MKFPDKWIYYDKEKEYKYPELIDEILKQKPNIWIKKSPIKDGPISPRLGYEGSIAYDTVNNLLIRHGGHNQGGGGQQGFETWTYDLRTGKWTLMYPNTSPPGTCCSRNNIFDEADGEFIRFPGFSGNHGWQWSRRIFNVESSVWTYNLRKNKWINRAPLPSVNIGPARAAAYDSDNQIILVYNVHESSRTAAYDPYSNEWTLLNPEKEPPAKMHYNPGMSMTYDSENRLFVLIGSGDGNDPRTFLYDIKKNEWKDAKPDKNPTYHNADPLISYDKKNKICLSVVQNREENCLETWAYDTKKNIWKKMDTEKEPDPTKDRQRQLCYAPDQNLFVLENRYSSGIHRISEQQIWTYKYADNEEEKIEPPKDLKIITEKNRINLEWKKASNSSYNVYHGIGEKPWLVEFRKIASVKENKFVHEKPKRDKINFYYVTSIDPENKESRPSLKIRAQPRIITDIVVSILDKNNVEIKWDFEEKDILGYNVYRAETEFKGDYIKGIYDFEKINKKLIKENSFVDKSNLDKIFAYRICAVNKLEVEGGPSPFFLTIPSPPVYVFSKEDGERCMLKWKKNPEKNIIGYNIYRTKYNKFDDEHDKINKKLIKENHFIDENAKKGMPSEPSNTGRRYYITAVDKLGQESFPSAPVWYRREWHKFYKLGVWHQ
ncbi:hypothetical protein GF336_01065 [Candidatus Woesearchaeota archaeon]|nr:hypothetical protein [Candidatus Woesearchaeota archaeon]